VYGGTAEVSRLVLSEAGLTDGAAGFYAGGAEEAGNLLNVKLDGVGAKDLGLREIGAGMSDLGHAALEVDDVFLEVNAGRRNVESPAVNTFRNISKA